MMTNEELETLKEKLLAIRHTLLAEVNRLSKDSNEEFSYDLPDMNDEASRTYNRQVLLSISEQDRKLLEQVEEALRMIYTEDGGYGICIDCEEEIPFQRLDAAPYVKRCVECKTQYEESLKEE